jgi:hypothetical protein
MRMPLAEKPTADGHEWDEDKKRQQPEPRPHNRQAGEGGGRRQRAEEWQAYSTDVLVALLDA